MRSGFEIVDGVTSADIAVRFCGNNMKEILTISAEAFLSIVLENPNVFQATFEKNILIKAKSEEMLLYRFLDELVFLKDAKKLLARLKEGEIEVVDGDVVFRGTLAIDEIDHRRHRFNVDIKAVTFHGLSCEKKNGGYSAQVVFDV